MSDFYIDNQSLEVLSDQFIFRKSIYMRARNLIDIIIISGLLIGGGIRVT